jgi:hypothetical protein
MSCSWSLSFSDDTPYGGPADLQPAGDLGFADAVAMQFPGFRSVYSRGCRSAQPFPVLARMRQASPRPFAQYFPFELPSS